MVAAVNAIAAVTAAVKDTNLGVSRDAKRSAFPSLDPERVTDALRVENIRVFCTNSTPTSDVRAARACLTTALSQLKKEELTSELRYYLGMEDSHISMLAAF